MGRSPCCDKAAVKRGPWTAEEDARLRSYMEQHGGAGAGKWMAVPRRAGLRRCGKSCRLRWVNYLRPGIRHGGFSADEDRLIVALHAAVGSRWSLIAAHLPGRTDNHVKNYWNTRLKKRLRMIFSYPNAGNYQPPPSPSPLLHCVPPPFARYGGYDVFAGGAGQSPTAAAATSYSSGVTAATELDEIFRSTGTSGGDCSSSAQTQSTDEMMVNWCNQINQLELQGGLLQNVQQQQQQLGFGMPYW